MVVYSDSMLRDIATCVQDTLRVAAPDLADLYYSAAHFLMWGEAPFRDAGYTAPLDSLLDTYDAISACNGAYYPIGEFNLVHHGYVGRAVKQGWKAKAKQTGREAANEFCAACGVGNG